MMRHQTVQKPPTKNGRLLSVRMLTALMCAFLIISATTATLLTTFHFSMTVTHELANKHVVGITAKAKGEVENFLKTPLSDVIGMQFIHANGTHPFPNVRKFQNPMWYKNYWDTIISAMRAADFKFIYFGIGFEDGNCLTCRIHNNENFRCEYVNSGEKGNNTIRVSYFTSSDSSLVRETISSTNYDPRKRGWYNLVSHTRGTIKWNRVYLDVDPIMPNIALNGVLFNETGTMLGVILITIAVADLDFFIDKLVTTSGSVSVLLDNDNVLLSSSHFIPFMTFRNVSLSNNETVPANCQRNRPKDYLNNILMCRETADTYKYPALRELKSTNPKILNEGTDGSSHFMTLDRADYFVTVAPIVTPMANEMKWRIVLFLPGADIIGGITEARDLAVYISISIIIFAVFVSFVIIRVLLQPLNTLAEDMYRVATLRDVGDVSDDPPVTTGADGTEPLKNGTTEPSLSFLSEIANLQFAFNAMRTELGKIKSYLPQSVL
eukprot:Tbor_TRINITY_DN5970_c1_g1::TRINITY_DN5970_c1_g1_i2::g.18588::m.18588